MLGKHRTIGDAAREFGVSPKTVRAWIEKGIIDEPPEIQHGLRRVKEFSEEFMKRAKEQIERYLANGSKPRKG